MKRFFRKSSFLLGAIIFAQTIIYIVAGAEKAYFHMDEMYSYGLASYDRVQLYEAEDFYGTWHSPEYYTDYLTAGEGDSWGAVYENQKNDVHPPVFYGLLRGVESLATGFSKWSGIGLNIVIAVGVTILTWLVAKELYRKDSSSSRISSSDSAAAPSPHAKCASVRCSSLPRTSSKLTSSGEQEGGMPLVLTAMVAFSMAAVSTVIYIRMYELLALWILMTTWLHLRLVEAGAERGREAGAGAKGCGVGAGRGAEVERGVEWKRRGILAGIFGVVLLGGLTQYYYWFYLAALFSVMVVRYARGGRWRELGRYAATVVGAGLVSLAIWPHALRHMFFSNRGEGVVQRFLHPGELLGDVWQYFGVVDRYAAHYLLLVAVVGMLVLGARALARGRKVEWGEEARGRYRMVFVPVMFYLLVVTAVSPFIELRYVAPVCGLFIVLVAIGVVGIVRATWGERGRRRVFAGLIVAFAVMPIVAGVEPDTMYRERAGVMEWARGKAGVPAMYVTKGEGDWVFLNDLPLIRELGESYVAKGVGEVRGALAGRDLSRGLVVIINDDYNEKGAVVEAVRKAAGMTEVEEVERMVTSDVYYLR